MRRYSFATIINTKNELPIATQLPFSVAELDGKLFITSHFAKSNEQSVCIEDQMSLIIFTEPPMFLHLEENEKAEDDEWMNDEIRQVYIESLEAQRIYLSKLNEEPNIDEDLIRKQLYLLDLQEERLKLG